MTATQRKALRMMRVLSRPVRIIDGYNRLRQANLLQNGESVILCREQTLRSLVDAGLIELAPGEQPYRRGSYYRIGKLKKTKIDC